MGMHKLKQLPPDIFTDEDLIALPIDVRMTGIGLRMAADDQGRESTTLWKLKAAIWPGTPDISEDILMDHMLLLDEAGYIGIYSAESRSYYAVRDWPAPSHPAASKHPAPPADLFQRRSSEPPDSRSAWEREGESERESGSETRSRSGRKPSAFCKIHQPNGTLSDCRHCGTARLAQDQWVLDAKDEIAAEPEFNS